MDSRACQECPSGRQQRWDLNRGFWHDGDHTVTWPLRHTTELSWGQCQLLVKDLRCGHHGDLTVPSKSSGSSAWGSRMTARNKFRETMPKHPNGLGCIYALHWKSPQTHTQWDQGNMRPHTAWDVHNRGSKDFSSRNLSGTTSRLRLTGPPWACLLGTGCWKGLGSSL